MTLSFVDLPASDNQAVISDLMERSMSDFSMSDVAWSISDSSARPARVVRTRQTDTTVDWTIKVGNQKRGATSLSLLPWDSEQLGITAARINYLAADGSYPQQLETKKALLSHLTKEAGRRGVVHLSARVDASDLSSLHILEQSGFITVDSILTFSIDLNANIAVPIHSDFTVRPGTAADAEPAALLALNAYTQDRFHSDPFIGNRCADRLHGEWVRNSFLGKAADFVLLATDATGLLGYVTCSVRKHSGGNTVGSIVLVASAAHARGRGVGYATTMAALEWFRDQGCDTVEVGTQLRNITASRLYQKCGFLLVGSSISLRTVL